MEPFGPTLCHTCAVPLPSSLVCFGFQLDECLGLTLELHINLELNSGVHYFSSWHVFSYPLVSNYSLNPVFILKKLMLCVRD